MGNTLANSVSTSGPTYTGTSFLRLDWWWNSPLYLLWRILNTVVSFVWVIIRTIISVIVKFFFVVMLLFGNYQTILIWLILLVGLWVWWFIAFASINLIKVVLPTFNLSIIVVILMINYYMDYLMGFTIVWNSVYPLIGFVLYFFLDIIVTIATEILRLSKVGVEIIEPFYNIVNEFMASIVDIALQVTLVVIRFLPIVSNLFVSQILPIAEVFTDIIPFLLPIYTWLFNKLFFTLAPILSLVVWAVNKVRKFFGGFSNIATKSIAFATTAVTDAANSFIFGGISSISLKRRNIRGLFATSIYLSHKLLQITAPFTGYNSTSIDFEPLTPVGFELSIADHEELDIALYSARTLLSVNVSESHNLVPFNDTIRGGGGHAPINISASHFAIPGVPVPHLSAAPQNHVDVISFSEDIDQVWTDVGITGSKFWGSAISVAAAKQELAEITDYMVTHPMQSTQYMMYEQKMFSEAHGITLGSDKYGKRTIQYVHSANVSAAHSATVKLWHKNFLDDLEKRCSNKQTYNTLDDTECLRLHIYKRQNATDQMFYMDSTLYGSGDGLDNVYVSKNKSMGVHNNKPIHAPTLIWPHQHIIHKAYAAGMSPHLMHPHHIDIKEIEHKHNAVVERLNTYSPHIIKSHIEADIIRAENSGVEHPLKYVRDNARVVGTHHFTPNYLDTITNKDKQLEYMKKRYILADVLEHAKNKAAKRFKERSKQLPHLQHHGSILLKSFTGLDNITSAIHHFATNHGSFHDLQHKWHEKITAQPWHKYLRKYDPARDTREFYDEWAQKQTFHMVLERDDGGHEQVRPVIYVELDSKNTRKLLFTLPLFEMLSRLDCYTTTPRAPLCLPDFLPDNFHLSTLWIPVIIPFPQVDGGRCFCEQFFCIQPRLLDKVFPGLATGKGALVNLLYFIGPCRWWNAIVFFLLIFQWVFVAFFLSLAAFLVEFPYFKMLLDWVFILPVGKQPTFRISFCMLVHLYDVVALVFQCWFFYGQIASPVWEVFMSSQQRIVGWYFLQKSYLETYWERKGANIEQRMFNEAYDSSMNTGLRDYNDPRRDTMNSLGIPQHSYPYEPAQEDPLWRPDTGNAAADRLRFGLGSGRQQHLLDYPEFRTRYEEATEENIHQPDAFKFYTQRPNVLDPYRDVTLPLAGGGGGGGGIGGEAFVQSNIQAIPDPIVASGMQTASTQQDNALHDMDDQAMRTLTCLIESIEDCNRVYGVPLFAIHDTQYNIWHKIFRWFIKSHHYSETWLLQYVQHRLHKLKKQKTRMPFFGPTKKR